VILEFKIAFMDVTWVDFIDVSLVAILLYQVYKMIRGSLAVNIFLGILLLYLIYLIVRAAQMELLAKILGQFMGVGVLAMIFYSNPRFGNFCSCSGAERNSAKIFSAPYLPDAMTTTIYLMSTR